MFLLHPLNLLPLPIGTGGTSTAPLARSAAAHSLQVEAAALWFYSNLQAGSWTYSSQRPVHTLYFILGGLFGGFP